MCAIKVCAKCIFPHFAMQEVLKVLVFLVFHAIEFFEGSIKCLYSFLSYFLEKFDGNVYFM
jgi:hypothetical protein